MFRPRTGLAIALAVAYVTCPLVEPLPNGPEPAEPWWLVVLGLASIASIVVAVAAVGRAARSAGGLTVLAGVGMFAMTATCPASGHHVTGWWTWWQAGMSAFVLLTGLALAVRPLRRDEFVEERPAIVVLPVVANDVVAPRGRRGPQRPEPVRPATARSAAGPAKTPERARSREPWSP